MQCCIDGHASVLSDYDKTGSSNILIHFHSNCLHLLDLLTKLGQNRIPPTLFNSTPPTFDARQWLSKYPCINAPTWPYLYLKEMHCFTANSF